MKSQKEIEDRITLNNETLESLRRRQQYLKGRLSGILSISARNEARAELDGIVSSIESYMGEVQALTWVLE